MNRLTTWTLVLSLTMPLFVAAEEPAYVPKAPLSALDLHDGDAIVFLGDSITHQCLYTQYIEDYFYTRFPKMRLRLHNAGVGGSRAWDAMFRFDRDVAAYRPKSSRSTNPSRIGSQSSPQVSKRHSTQRNPWTLTGVSQGGTLVPTRDQKSRLGCWIHLDGIDDSVRLSASYPQNHLEKRRRDIPVPHSCFDI